MLMSIMCIFTIYVNYHHRSKMLINYLYESGQKYFFIAVMYLTIYFNWKCQLLMTNIKLIDSEVWFKSILLS